MKRIALFLTIGFLFLQSCSSVHTMSDFYSKYENEATIIPIPKFALQFAAKQTNSNEFIKYLNSAKVFVLKKSSPNKQSRVLKDLKSSIRGEHYQDLISLKNNQNSLQISILENDGKVQRMILGISGFQNVMVIESKMNVLRTDLEKALENISDDDVEAIKDLIDN